MDIETTDLDVAAGVFSALGDPIRLRIVDVLRGGTRCVCEVLEAVDIAPSLLSYHLRVLREAGLIEATRRGRWVDYRLVDGGLAGLRDLLEPEGTP